MIYAQPFVALWLAPEFSEAATAMMILSLGTAIFLPQIIGNSVLFGVEKHQYILLVLIFEVAAKVALAIVLVPQYGIIGMALANSAPQVVLYLTLYPALMARVLNLSYWRLLWRNLSAGIPAAAITLAVGWLMQTLLYPDNWPCFLVNVLAVSTVIVAIGWLIIESDDRERLKVRFRRN